MKTLKEIIGINNKGLLKAVSKRKKHRQRTMLELFGTPLEKDLMTQRQKQKAAKKK